MKKRVISAIIMVAVFIPLLIMGELPFAIFMTILGMFGFYELVKVRESKKKFPTWLKVLAYFMIAFFALNNVDSSSGYNQCI